MKTTELPNAETIRKFARATPDVTPVAKNGTPLATTGEFRSQWMEVTPAMARTWLKNNFRNRPVAEDVVAAYARDMINRVWIATHQGIAFNDRDELIDGQHRLLAVVKSGCTVRMMVTFGLPSKIDGSEMTTMDCVDRGRTRSVADQLKVQHGLSNATQIAQIASSLAGLCHERVRRLSVGQALDIYRAFKPGMDFVIEHRSKQAGLKSAGVLAGFVFVRMAEDCMVDFGPFCLERFQALNSGAGLEKFPNVRLLREFLTSTDASLILASMNRGIAELTVQVLWLELFDKRVEKLEFALDGVQHFRRLQPERVAKVAAMFRLPAPEISGAAPEQLSGTGRNMPAKTETKEPVAAPVPSSVPSVDPVRKFPPMGKPRPTLELILAKIEIQTKLSRFIITGRGSDPEIDRARGVFVHIARSFGHTDSAVAAVLKRSAGQVRELYLPADAMATKLRQAVEKMKLAL